MNERQIVAIDLGTSKIALTVAKIDGDDIQIVYYRETPSQGVRYSRVINPKKASGPLKEAIADAENELGIKITQVVVGLPKYEVLQATATMKNQRNANECITGEEIENIKEMAINTYPLEDKENFMLFGAVAQSFSAEGEFQIIEEDVIGMAPEELESNFKVFIGQSKYVRDINTAFKNAGDICISHSYFTPDAIADAVLYHSEMENGVALIDFGAGVTSVSIYHGNIMRHYAAIRFGGKSVTSDLQSECVISEKLAENIKLAYGACMPDRLQNLSEKTLHISSNDATPSKKISVKYLSEIITARTREIIEAILYEIQKSGYADMLKSGVVITGGGANLVNISTLIRELSGYEVRRGYPKHLFSATGCEEIYNTSAATSIGLILMAKNGKAPNCALPAEDAPGNTGGIKVEDFGAKEEPHTDENGDYVMFNEKETISEEHLKEKERKEKERKEKEKKEKEKERKEKKKKEDGDKKPIWDVLFEWYDKME